MVLKETKEDLTKQRSMFIDRSKRDPEQPHQRAAAQLDKAAIKSTFSINGTGKSDSH